MRRCSIFPCVLIVLANVMSPTIARGCRSLTPLGQLYRDIALVGLAIHMYEDEFGPLPASDSTGRDWVQIMRDGGYYCNIEPGGWLTGNSKYRLVYVPDTLLRCLGPNHIDDGGGFDDFEIQLANETTWYSYEDFSAPNWEVWYSQEWSEMRSKITLRSLIAAIIGVTLGFLIHRWFVAAFGMVVCYGLLLRNVSEAETSVFQWPYWVELTEGTASFALFISGLTFFIWSAAKVGVVVRDVWRHAFHEDDQMRCRACGYSLVGLVSNVCPECGGRIGKCEPTTFHP